MKVLLAADGSKFTKKALTFLITSNNLATADDELIVFHVQDPVSPLIKKNWGLTRLRPTSLIRLNRC